MRLGSLAHLDVLLHDVVQFPLLLGGRELHLARWPDGLHGLSVDRQRSGEGHCCWSIGRKKAYDQMLLFW